MGVDNINGRWYNIIGDMMRITKTNPKVIENNHIVTERHKAEDIIKMGRGWRKVGEVSYQGITYWEIVR